MIRAAAFALMMYSGLIKASLVQLGPLWTLILIVALWRVAA